MQFLKVFASVTVIVAIVFAWDIKGTVYCDRCEPSEISYIGEVYLFNSSYTLIDSVCIDDYGEYRFTGLPNGIYYVKVKVDLSPGCPDDVGETSWYTQTDSTQIVISGHDGGAVLNANALSIIRTSCR